MPGRKAAGVAGGDLFVARSSFALILDGRQVLIHGGQVVDANDPVLTAARDKFQPFAPQIRNYPGRVEQATAAPGEKRA